MAKARLEQQRAGCASGSRPAGFHKCSGDNAPVV